MRTRRLPPRRVLALVAPVCTVGLALAGAAAVEFATDSHSATTIAGVLALLAASMLADRFPVPLDGTDSGRVSLAFAFGVSAIVLFGWAAGALVVFAAPAVVQLLEHRPLVRVGFNASVFAIAAARGRAADRTDRNWQRGVHQRGRRRLRRRAVRREHAAHHGCGLAYDAQAGATWSSFARTSVGRRSRSP